MTVNFFDGMSDDEILAVLKDASARCVNGVTDLGNGFVEVGCRDCRGYGVFHATDGGLIECATCRGRGYWHVSTAMRRV
jgi:hypothetical protein